MRPRPWGPAAQQAALLNLGADALHSAIKNYLDRKAGKVTDTEADKEPHHKHEHEREGCYCPYCSKQVEEESPMYLFAARISPMITITEASTREMRMLTWV